MQTFVSLAAAPGATRASSSARLCASSSMSCVYRKRRPFDLLIESLYLSDDGRAAMLLIDAAVLAVQVENPT
jgi:hypothetical protein